jgi:hypothetical protein
MFHANHHLTNYIPIFLSDYQRVNLRHKAMPHNYLTQLGIEKCFTKYFNTSFIPNDIEIQLLHDMLEKPMHLGHKAHQNLNAPTSCLVHIPHTIQASWV